MLLNPREYLAELERAGLHSPSSPVPEHTATVWNTFLELYDSHIGSSCDIELVVTPAGLGFYRDPLDAESDIYTWALTGALCHPILPFSPAQLVDRAGSILEAFDRDGIAQPTIVTETFELSGAAEAETDRYFLWVNSPRARIHDDFADYVGSLSSNRRHEMRRLFESFSEPQGFRFELSDRRPDFRELDFIIKNLHQRWGEKDMPYALVQSLWPVAVSTNMPARALFMRVYYKGLLAFLNGFILRDEVIISQSTCKNEELSVSGLGTLIDFQTIRMLSGSHIRYLDPTCQTSTASSESIGIAKRKVVSDNARKPLLLTGYHLPMLVVEYPYLDPVHGWVIPDTALDIGKPA